MSGDPGGRGMGGYRAYANSGLESLAAEASRRAESLEADLDNHDRDQEPEPKSPTSKGKVRKAYTITKQRERWTEEEHDRFLQALKRYGRAWRKIEEHIGTKTAVQIRSHAQKFFSKLQREQSMNGGRDESSKNDISIPPPRPKRKPMHPYPRNSVDSHSDPLEQARSTRQQANPTTKHKDSEATASTQVPTSNQYSTSSGHQPSMLNTPSLFQGQHTPFAGSIMSPQPSQVQLPPFPSLDTSGGENMTKVLKDAAMAAASAWNQVISGASPKVQTLIQAQSFQPLAMQSVPSMWTSQYLDMEQNPFMRQLLLQAAQTNVPQQTQTTQEPLSQRHGHPMYGRQQSTSNAGSHQQETMNNAAVAFLQGQQKKTGQQEKPEHGRGESDRDSACSKEDARQKFSHSTFDAAQAPAYWSTKTPYSHSEAKLGRTAWEMMNRVTAEKSRELNAKAKTEEISRPKLMGAPSTGASGASRRIMKPIAHSARISPLHARDANLQSSTVCSDTSQLAHFYQRAAAHADAQRGSQSPENYRNGSTLCGENGSTGDKEDGSNALYATRKSDKGSNDGTGSDTAKDQESNGSDQVASPKLQDLNGTQFSEDGKKEDLGSNGANAKGNGSDKASNNGNGNGSSDEDAHVNGSDLNATATEEKGSNNGLNDDQDSPREATPGKEDRSATPNTQKEAQKAHNYSHGALPHDAETVWAAASLQNQQKPTQDGNKQRRQSQAEMVQQILPFTLTRDQQAAISSWAAANAHSQPQQYQFMQSLLNGLTSQNPDTVKASQGPSVIDRQISSLTSHDTGSNTDCNIPSGIGRSLVLDSHRSAPGDLHKRPSGFQPYNKRPAESSLAFSQQYPPTKRFAATSPSDKPQYREPQLFRSTKAEDASKVGKPYNGLTPFGSRAAQSSQLA